MPATTDDITPALSSSAAPAQSATTSANTSFTGLETLDTPSDYRSIPSDTRVRRSFSREHSSAGQRLLALANDCTPDIYGYSSSEKKNRATDDNDNRCSAATLVNGLPYHRVRHTETPNAAFSFNLFPDALPEYHRNAVENVQRPPVSPLGNQGAY